MPPPPPARRGATGGPAPGARGTEFPLGTILTDFVRSRDETGDAPPPADLDEEEIEVADDTPEMAQVRRFAHALAKAVRVVRLYPSENPVSVKFAGAAMTALEEAFRIMDSVRITVGKSKLFFHGEPVLEEAGGEETVSGRMFWDGIREVSFHVGLGPEELLRFLRLFRIRAQGEDAGEDDFVTLLWNHRFEHVTYIALDDILDLESESDPVPEEFGTEFMNFVDLDMHNLEDEEEFEAQASAIAAQVKAKLAGSPELDGDGDPLFGISEEERESIREEVKVEESPKMLEDILQIIAETLFLEQEDDSFVSLVLVLSGTMLSLLGEGRFGEAAEVVRILRELREERDDLTPAMTACLDSGLKAVWDETRREVILSHLGSGNFTDAESIRPFFALLPEDAVGVLFEMQGDLTMERGRRVVDEALAARVIRNPEPLLPYLRDERQEVVLRALRILSRTRRQDLVGAFKDLLRHPDFLVRREALAALSRVGGGKAVDVLVRALEDPDKRIRVSAARSLAVTGRLAIPLLLGIIQENAFDDRDLTEKRALYESLAFAGGKAVLSVMEDALARRTVFKKQKAEEARACACEALGWIGGREARELVSRHLKEKSVLVRTAAQSALRRIDEGVDRDAFLKEAA